MKTLYLFLIVIMVTACSCNPIKYSPDLAFLNSAQANSMEYLVRLNGSACIDMDNKVGLCAKRIPSDKSLFFTQDARPYGYRIYIKCSKSVGVDESFDINPETAWTYEIKPEKFAGVKSFTCIGEIFPFDRDQEVSALWSSRLVIFDGKYIPRETVYKTKRNGKNYLVMGKHSKYVFYDGTWKKEKTAVKYKKEIKFAYSESERMRFNYYYGN